MSAIEVSAAAFGLQPIWDADKVEPQEVYLWPENVEAWNTFQACRTQWIVGVGGPTGLHYSGVDTVLRLRGVKQSKRLDVFSKIQVMERAMLEAWSEQRNG